MLVHLSAAILLLYPTQSSAPHTSVASERQSVTPPASADANRTELVVNKAAALVD